MGRAVPDPPPADAAPYSVSDFVTHPSFRNGPRRPHGTAAPGRAGSMSPREFADYRRSPSPGW